MAFSDELHSRVKILVKILPLLEGFPDFALKVGSAINFFYRDLDRLSVDIDLTYIPLEDRKDSIEKINGFLSTFKKLIESRLGYQVEQTFTSAERLSKLQVNAFESDFIGMMEDDFIVQLDDLIEVQKSLPDLLLKALDSEERKFILSAEEGNPDWSCLNLGDFSDLPGIRWKLLNIAKMDHKKKKQSLEKLKRVLEL